MLGGGLGQGLRDLGNGLICLTTGFIGVLGDVACLEIPASVCTLLPTLGDDTRTCSLDGGGLDGGGGTTYILGALLWAGEDEGDRTFGTTDNEGLSTVEACARVVKVFPAFDPELDRTLPAGTS
jgi:hypothetical protein